MLELDGSARSSLPCAGRSALASSGKQDQIGALCDPPARATLRTDGRTSWNLMTGCKGHRGFAASGVFEENTFPFYTVITYSVRTYSTHYAL